MYKSERGNIKDIQKRNTQSLEENPTMTPTAFELRMKALYDYAALNRNSAMINTIGLIVIDGAPNDPVSLMRHREYIKELSEKHPHINTMKNEYNACFDKDSGTMPSELINMRYKKEKSLQAISSDDKLVKNAADGSAQCMNSSFWRAK